jgi:hypothetical protein
MDAIGIGAVSMAGIENRLSDLVALGANAITIIGAVVIDTRGRRCLEIVEHKLLRSMSPTSTTIDELIVRHMNELNQLVQRDIEWMEAQSDLNDYALHVSNLESNLQIHADRMNAYRERAVRQLTEKCGRSGADIYASELSNIRTRRFFARIAGYFCRKFEK